MREEETPLPKDQEQRNNHLVVVRANQWQTYHTKNQQAAKYRREKAISEIAPMGEQTA